MNIIEGIVSVIGIISITFISICLIYAKYWNKETPKNLPKVAPKKKGK